MSASDKYTLKPSLCETFRGIIWKVETDDKNTIVAIESRSIADRLTYFSAFDYSSGKCLFKEITVEDSWFWSLDRVHEGYVLLHSYVNESNPEHKGIIAINSSGQIEWQQFHKTLYEVVDEGLVIYNPKIQPKIFELVSTDKAELMSSNLRNYAPALRNIIVPDMIINDLTVKHWLPENYTGPVFYCNHNCKDILAFHTKADTLYAQQLAVYQGPDLVFEDFLAIDIPKLNPEAFFIEKSHLFYIRSNKQEFVSYLV